jgi:hypothetical protein
LEGVSSAFSGEPGPLDITVTAEVVGERGDSVILQAVIEDGRAAEGGEIDIQISGSAMRAYGIEACVAELERVLNCTLLPEYRLEAALAVGAQGPFLIVKSDGAGPSVRAPATRRLAA